VGAADGMSAPGGSGTDGISVEVRDGVAVVTLQAPERRNALTVAMAEALVQACRDIDDDPQIGAVVLTAKGPYFCAGGDRATLTAAGEDPASSAMQRSISAIYDAFVRVGHLLPPTIAAIRGGAVGAGLNLALATDVRVVAEDAVFLSGFLPIGLHPGGGHGALLTRTAGPATAKAMQLFGAEMSGTRAVELGLAWAAVPKEDVLPRALALAAVPAADPELARRTAASVRMISGPPHLSWEAALEVERAAQMWSMRRKHLGQAPAGAPRSPATQ